MQAGLQETNECGGRIDRVLSIVESNPVAVVALRCVAGGGRGEEGFVRERWMNWVEL